MSEKEKQAAIAKMKAQALRRWMTLLIVIPVFICAILTLIAPAIRDYLARQQANDKCVALVDTVEPVSNSTVFEIEGIAAGAVITADNLAQMVLFEGEARLGLIVPSRDNVPAINHPADDYFIYSDYQSGESINFYICDDTGEARGAFTGDEDAGDLVFSSDGALFAIADNGQIRLFDAENIRPVETINVRGDAESRRIDSIAFHPTESLLFITSEDEFFVYELENYSEVFRVPMFETIRREIGFNADGTLFFMSSIGDSGTVTYVWGVRE